MRVTINDIARISGFSKTSVSFAFNDPTRISKETREKILRVAEEVGYVPDPVARNLSTKKLGTIGFLLPHAISKALLNPYLSQIMLGVGQICHVEEYSLTLVPPLRGVIDDGVRTAAVDGFITLGLQPEMKVVQLIRQRHIPFVTIDGRPADEIPSINIDDREGADRAMRYVLEAGHRKICIATLEHAKDPDERQFVGVPEWRMKGYADAFDAYGINPNTDTLKIEAEASIDGGRRIVQQIFSGPESTWPTALVCMSDIVAVGAILELRARNIPVPGRVSVLGFDDIPEAAMVAPGLTTIAQPGKEKGLRAAEMLFRLLQKKEGEMHLQFTTELIVRSSVGSMD